MSLNEWLKCESGKRAVWLVYDQSCLGKGPSTAKVMIGTSYVTTFPLSLMCDLQVPFEYHMGLKWDLNVMMMREMYGQYMTKVSWAGDK